MTDSLKQQFEDQRKAEITHWKNIIINQIRNAIVELEEDDIAAAIERLKALIGDK